jgi:diaminopimelate epimerase
MTTIPFAKLHGAENDFLLTWADRAPTANLPEIARSICARNTGIGADGWMLVERESVDLRSDERAGTPLRTRLFNSDGSTAEISGNGTRCAAAFGLLQGALSGSEVEIITVAGTKTLRVIEQSRHDFMLEMDMGVPAVEAISTPILLQGREFDATLLNVGNPQCALFIEELPVDWRAVAAEAEGHPRFHKRSNVSLVRITGQHQVEAVFYERGAGETRSSGTGSTGAAVAAILRGKVTSPVEILTPAGSMTLRWDESVYLTGPAKFIGEGVYFLDF